MAHALTLRNKELALAGPIGNLDGYLNAIGQIPVLSADEERQLARRYRDDRDLDAARHLVLSHLRFVAHIARGYRGYGLPLGDLIQEGNIGLMKAVKRFDPEVGVRLISFGVHWIRAEMHEYILRNWRIVKVATTKAQRKLFFNLRKNKKRLGWFNAEEIDTVADELGVSAKQVVEMESRLAGQDVAFDHPVADDDERPLTPSDWLSDSHPDPAEEAERNDWETRNENRLQHALTGLDERSREIVSERWLAEKKSTLQELADRFGVSAERIRQLEGNAIRKLHSAMAV